MLSTQLAFNNITVVIDSADTSEVSDETIADRILRTRVRDSFFQSIFIIKWIQSSSMGIFRGETTLPKGEINARDIHRSVHHKQLLTALINAPSCAIKKRGKSYVWGESDLHYQF